MDNYEDLAQKAENGELHPVPGTIKHGKESQNEVHELLMEATGTNTIEAARKAATKNFH